MKRKEAIAIGYLWSTGVGLLSLLLLLCSSPRLIGAENATEPEMLSGYSASHNLYGPEYSDSTGLVITGTRHFTTPLTVLNGLSLSGTFTATKGLFVNGGLTVTGALIVEGPLIVDAPLVKPEKIINGLYTVDAATTISEALRVNGDLMVHDRLIVIGSLHVTTRTVVAGQLTVLGQRYELYLPLVTNINPRTTNGDFEQGTVLWGQFSTADQALIRPGNHLGVPPHNGWWAAQLGVHDNEVAMISQGVTIAKEYSCLSYWEWTRSADACDADYGGVGVDGKWFAPRSLCSGTATGQWMRRLVDMSIRTNTVESSTFVLNFAVVNDYSVPSTMYIDDITFETTKLCTDSVSSSADSSRFSRGLIGRPITDEISYSQ